MTNQGTPEGGNQPEPTIPATIVAQLVKAARFFSNLHISSTLRSGKSTLTTPGTPARRAVQNLGLEVEEHPDATKIKSGKK